MDKECEGGTNNNVIAIDNQSADDSNANKFHFMQGSYYTFSCTVDDDPNKDSLTTTIKNPQGDMVKQKALKLLKFT
jgi:hypothetical protein